MAVLASIAVTKPVKARYRTGENFDYTGAIVTANYSDGSIENVTEDATFSPANGSLVTSNDPTSVIVSPVTVSYGGKQASFDITTGGVAIVSLSVTPPNKTVYYVGETIDYTGCTVTAVYWDGTTKDVTNQVTFSRSAGSFMTDVERDNLNQNVTVPVEVTYEETDVSLVSNIVSNELVRAGYEGIDESNRMSIISPNAYAYYVHNIKYNAWNTDTGSIENKTLEYTFRMSFAANHWYDYDYWDSEGNLDISKVPLYGDDFSPTLDPPEYIEEIIIRNIPQQMDWRNKFYVNARQYGFYRLSFNILADLGFYKSTGKGWMVDYYRTSPISSVFVPILQLSYGSEASTTVNIYCKLIHSLTILQPTKVTYHYNQPFDPTGLTAVVTYTDGETKDVTSEVVVTPTQGTTLTSSQTGRVQYNQVYNGYTDQKSVDFAITVITLQSLDITPPTKTSYNSGETIDYTGATVTATYSDGSTEDVTSSAVFSPSAGTTITQDTTVSVSYTNQWSETASSSFALSVVTNS